ncbi:Disease resistance protein [Macleaya cordata]|uniref:Disease resistance protein n=1 Tax=Macleaya cordata TaxID=56857 RepID=A0A200QKI3_MACCD|nr:Disease resistance protein [Macleaya cordata]
MGGVGKTTLLKKLNNEFLKRNHDFDLVLWVVVSKDLNLERVQKGIADSLELSWSGERDLNRGAKDIFKALSKIKFVLLLDDIWQRLVDLRSIGIPSLMDTSTQETKSKVVFTTRSEAVCGFMEVDKMIRVKCLDSNETWSLFQNKVGQEALNCHPKVPKLAKLIAEECGGLPLALVTIGRTMASKKTIQEWKHAITVLKRSASEFSGMGDEVLPILKSSYDNLGNDKNKSCFLYCSLYPEDYSIKNQELIYHWIAEGFIDAYHDIDEARNEGYDVIGCLKGACLLESGDDVETQVKISGGSRIFHQGRKKGKFLVQASNRPERDEWEKEEKISLINNGATELIGTPKCLNLSTLLLQHSNVSTISDDFFPLMPRLRVLNMASYPVMKLPTSITSLSALEYLNLSYRKAFLRPHWLRRLVELKYLDLSYTYQLHDDIAPGDIACLSKLQMLDFYLSSFRDWEVERRPSLSELEILKHLNYLGITIGTDRALEKLVSSQKLQLCTRRLYISNYESSNPFLALSRPRLLSASLNLANMINLKELYMFKCHRLEELRISWVAEDEEEITLLTTLERLQIEEIPNLRIVWDELLPHHLFCSINLHYVEIVDCHALKDFTWLIYAKGLKELVLRSLNGLEEIISDGCALPPMLYEKYSSNSFSRLTTLDLILLPNLKSICKHTLAFPYLERIQGLQCPQLKKLPFDTNSAKNTIREIRGETEWWESLEWEDEITKSTFVPYFVET